MHEVGRGSTGTVYLSHDPFYGRDVAIRGDAPIPTIAAQSAAPPVATMSGRAFIERFCRLGVFQIPGPSIVVRTSVQKRAIKTLHLALEACGRLWIPETKDWRLNERHYGGLTGLDKAETAAKHGDDQVKVWRRSFDVPPPPLEANGPFDLASDARYAGIAIPATESLKLTIERVLPYWQSTIVPQLAAGETVLVAAHGNSLRALVKHLSGISDADITGLEIPTGQPIVYDFDANMVPGERHYLKDR